ncbi:hypothetical protein XH97_28540 [Bradyrhizobium sp. CCBAU 53380]|nr:hypothetical protein [Bradyrhizobium sp. CCBAU 53380]
MRGSGRLFAGAAGVAIVLAIGVTIWPFLTEDQLGTPPGGANPATRSDTTASRGAPAQNAAQSTVGRTDPAGLEDSAGGRARAIKQSSHALTLDPRQRSQIRNVIADHQDAPKIEKAPFEMMIGAAVPEQVATKDIPVDLTKIMNGYWGDQYLLVQNDLVIVDQHSRRVVAIVPSAL